MNATQPKAPPAHLVPVITLANLLERLESSAVPVDPDQYRVIVERLTHALDGISPDDAFRAVLNHYPAASELYENLNYAHAGLCRSPLEAALQAELRTRELLARVSAE